MSLRTLTGTKGHEYVTHRGIMGAIKRRRKLSEDEIDRFYLWLHTTPGYREMIRQRISEEQKRRRKRDFNFATRRRALWKRYHPNEPYPEDVDNLGREVEGCG